MFPLFSQSRTDPNKEVRGDSTLAPDYNLSDQPETGVLFDADLESLCLPIHTGPGIKGKTPAAVFVRCLRKPKTPTGEKIEKGA